MTDATYDMKKKLLELKSELLKSSAQQAGLSSVGAGEAQEKAQSPALDEIVSLLREISNNQQKILEALSRSNSKVEGI